MEHIHNKEMFSFYKNWLGSSLTILCDYSFVRWCALKHKDAQVAICSSFGLKKLISVKITRCVRKKLTDWHTSAVKRNLKVDSAVIHMLPGVDFSCSHHVELDDSSQCIREVLKTPNSRRYVLASADVEFCTEIRKSYSVPIITVRGGKIVVLPPTKSQKREARVAKEQKAQHQKFQEERRERALAKAAEEKKTKFAEKEMDRKMQVKCAAAEKKAKFAEKEMDRKMQVKCAAAEKKAKFAEKVIDRKMQVKCAAAEASVEVVLENRKVSRKKLTRPPFKAFFILRRACGKKK